MNKQQLFETLYEPTIINGHTWQFVGDGWLDIQTGLVWMQEEKNVYTYDKAMSLFCSKDKRLATKEEYGEAENHGIRDVMKFKEFYWTSSVHPSDSNYSFVFDGYFGYFLTYEVSGINNSVRCVREYV